MKRLNIINSSIKDIKIIKRNPIKDYRGFFDRMFCDYELKKLLKDREIKQINHSFTKKKGTLRGLHFQYKPYEETKIISCLKGKIFDVSVDMRKNSKTYLKSFSITLSEKNKTSLFVPEGFAHGFQTLEDNCILIYFHTEYYKHNKSGYVNTLDPKLNIKWPLNITRISKIDAKTKFLR